MFKTALGGTTINIFRYFFKHTPSQDVNTGPEALQVHFNSFYFLIKGT